MSAVYVVRSGLSRNFFLIEPRGSCAGKKLNEAHKFMDLESAKKGFFLGRVLYRLRWKLVWFSNGMRATPENSHHAIPQYHGRYDSKEEALNARYSATYYGADGPDDREGWKVVPVLRRVKK